MEESIHRFDWDDAFCFVFGHSICEPITPYRLCVYLLIRCLDAEHRQHAFTSKQIADLSSLIYSLIWVVNLSFPEMCRLIEKSLERIGPGLYKDFMKKVDEHRGDVEILIRRDELLQQPRRCDRGERAHPLITSKSLFGIFVRKVSEVLPYSITKWGMHEAPLKAMYLWQIMLAVTRSLQSVSELQHSHAQWLDWLNDKRPTARSDLFGGYVNGTNSKTRFSLTPHNTSFATSNDVIHLAPLFDEVHLSVAKQPHRENMTNEKQSGESTDSISNDVLEQGCTMTRRNDVFKYDGSPGTGSGKGAMEGGIAKVQPLLGELLSSGRARAFLMRQLRLLQVSPDEAMPTERLIAACAFIKSNYPHLAAVHLLEMLDGVRRRDAFAAEHALREYFDWTTIHINECQTNATNITAIDMRPLRYAPLLHARLARFFTQREHARNLLIEAMQQAQANRDLVCLRLAVVEQAAIDSLASPQPRRLNNPKNKHSKPASDTSDLLTSVYKISPVVLMSMWASESSIDDEAEVTDNEEGLHGHVGSSEMRAFIRQLRDCTTLLSCIEQAITCENLQSMHAGLQSCIMVDYGAGREWSTRTMNEAARAIVCTVKLQNGFTTSAFTDANMLLYLNTGDTYCRRYDTEAQVIAAVNAVYSHAINGRYSSALSLLESIKQRFTMKNNWPCAMHWKRCECMVRFDRAFMFGEWTDAERWLEYMRTLAPDEADLRKAVLQFCKGYIIEATDLALHQVEKCKNLKNIRLRLRCEMVLAMIYASSGNLYEARSILQRCRADAIQFHLENFEAIIVRRLASVDAMEGHTESALANIDDCGWVLRTRCSRLENALLQITIFTVHAKCKSSQNLSDREALIESTLAYARNECRRACAPLLEKALLLEAAKLYNSLQRIELRDECAAAFREIDLKCPTSITWTVF